MLDCNKSKNNLGWSPVWNLEVSISKTINWYKNFYNTKNISTMENLIDYIDDAKKQNKVWT